MSVGERTSAIAAGVEDWAVHASPARDAAAIPRPSVLAGLIGAGIQASRTPSMHEREGEQHGLRYVYKLIDLDRLGLDAAALPELIEAAERLGFTGLNITHPCKHAAAGLVHELQAEAEAIGAINTILFTNGRRIGHNTDCTGFAAGFRREMPDADRDAVVILGAGGAGAAVAYALLTLDAKRLAILDIDHAKAERLAAALQRRFGAGCATAITDLADAVGAADGLINATPVGMEKYQGVAIDPALLRPALWVADIVYFPAETELLRRARERGCRTMSGAAMAVFQAVDAFRLFTGVDPDPQRMHRHFDALGGSQQ
jgi:shikimate dehydrogenase